MRHRIIYILRTFSLLAATISYAGVYNTLNYSGRIVNSDGRPLKGPVDLEVNFFDARSGGNQKGGSYSFSATALTDGLFNLEIDILDSDIPTILDPSSNTFVEVTDNTNSKVYPRQKINSMPYAQQAGGLAGYPLPSANPSSAGQVLKWNGAGWYWDDDATGGSASSVSSIHIVDNSITSTDILDGAISSSDLAGDAVDSSTIADGSVATTDLADNSVTNDKLAGSISDLKLTTIATLKSQQLCNDCY